MSAAFVAAVADPRHDAARAVSRLLSALGEDPSREGLQRTPDRVARAMADLTSGYAMTVEEAVGEGVFEEDTEELVIVRDIEFYSLCEHHLLPFNGRIHVAYLPQGRVLGLSKLPRIVDVFARRLQVQERLTGQVADAVQRAAGARGVAVMAEAAHFCMMMRGVRKQRSKTQSFAWRGAFRDDAVLRREFLQALGAGRRPRRPRPSKILHGF
ncbi:MAG: GTP cyclohydrolase I FolE [Vicinamibacteria bacterium]|nr:GTP cyclohydrolase I FolE [Vicinamibacteria bacterium]